MSPLGLIIAGGIFGGVLRGLAGIAKELVTTKNPVINWTWFAVSIATSAIVGLFSGIAIQLVLQLGRGEDFLFALLAGYAGADFIETLYKMKLKGELPKLAGSTAKPST